MISTMNKSKLYRYCLLFLLFTPLIANAALKEPVKPQLNSIGAITDLAEQFSQNLAKGGVDKAYEILQPYWQTDLNAQDKKITKARGIIDALTTKHGNAIGYELVYHKEIGTSIYQIIMLQKYQDQAYFWQLIFYRPTDHWIVNDVRPVGDMGSVLSYKYQNQLPYSPL